MSIVRVPILGTVGKAVRINPDATVGATFGTNLFDANGDVLTLAMLATLVNAEIATIDEGTENSGVFESEIIDGTILARVGDNETITGQYTFEARVDIDNGAALRIHDSTDADYAEFLHDGTDFNTPFVGTTDWNITGLTAIRAGTVDLDVDALTFGTIEGIAAADFSDSFSIYTGAFLDSPSVAVASNGTTITLSFEQDGGGDVRIWFSDGVYTFDATPTATVSLTAGTDTVPTLNYIYVLYSNKTLTASTAGWPAAEHAPVATVLCESAASAQTDGVYKVHAWTDHFHNAETGHLAHLNYWIRQQHATWVSGVALTPTVGAATFDLATSTGMIQQLHPHSYPAFDTSASSELMIVNDSVTAFDRVGDLVGVLTDASGGSMSGRYYNLVIWGVVSEDDGDCQLMVNLPTGSYSTESDALSDANGYSVFNIPANFKGTGFLIARLTVRHTVPAGGTYAISENADLRGLFPSTSPGSGGSGLDESAADLLYLRLDATNDPVTAQVDFDGGLRVRDALGTDSVAFTHDGADLNVVGVNTTDINLSGITALQAGTVDADFDAITATSYGGIAEANLVDGSVGLSELTDWRTYSATGDRWDVTTYVASDGVMEVGKYIDFHNTDTDVTDNSIRLTSGVGTLNVGGALTATSFGGIAEANLLDKTVAETIAVDWLFSSGLSVQSTVSNIGQVGQFAFIDVSSSIGRFGSFNFDTAAWTPVQVHGLTAEILGDSGVTVTGSSVDLQGGTVSVLGQAFRVYDALETDYGQFSHDGTDFNTTLVNTTTWNISGAGVTLDTGTQTINGSTVNIGPTGNVNINPGGNMHLLSGKLFRIFDSGNTDYAQFNHDGTDFNTALVNTTEWNISGAPTKFHQPIRILGEIGTSDSNLGVEFGGRASTATALDSRVQGYIGVFNTGGPVGSTAGDLLLTPRTSIATSIRFATGSPSPSQRFYISDSIVGVTGGALRIFDSTGTDYADFSHDGTDFNTPFVNTADWNITGLTGNVLIDGEPVATAEMKYKDTDTGRISTATLADDPDLAGWALQADTVYSIEMFLPVTCASDVPDFKFLFQLSNALQSSRMRVTYSTFQQAVDVDDTVAIPVVSGAFGTPISIKGTFTSNATTGGTMDFQWAQNGSFAATTTLERGAWCRVTRLGPA